MDRSFHWQCIFKFAYFCKHNLKICNLSWYFLEFYIIQTHSTLIMHNWNLVRVITYVPFRGGILHPVATRAAASSGVAAAQL